MTHISLKHANPMQPMTEFLVFHMEKQIIKTPANSSQVVMSQKNITLSSERTRQIAAVVHIESARASSEAANFAFTFENV